MEALIIGLGRLAPESRRTATRFTRSSRPTRRQSFRSAIEQIKEIARNVNVADCSSPVSWLHPVSVKDISQFVHMNFIHTVPINPLPSL